MAKEYIRLFLTKHTRCLKVETDKAYAIKAFKENVFVPKSHCKLHTLEDNEHYRWTLDVPIWLAIKRDEVADAIMYIQELNEWRETEMKAKVQEGLEIINEYLKDN